MNHYFYTFGTDCGFPYQGGWVEVRAESRMEADKKFRTRFPDRPGRKGILNCAFCYTMEEWSRMDPEHTWKNPECHEVIE